MHSLGGARPVSHLPPERDARGALPHYSYVQCCHTVLLSGTPGRDKKNDNTPQWPCRSPAGPFFYGEKTSGFGGQRLLDVGHQAALLDLARLGLTSDVARNYFELRTAQRQIRLMREDIAALEDRAALLQARVEGGVLDHTDLQRQRAELAALKAQLPPLLAATPRPQYTSGVPAPAGDSPVSATVAVPPSTLLNVTDSVVLELPEPIENAAPLL